jgi:hypothetical protein
LPGLGQRYLVVLDLDVPPLLALGPVEAHVHVAGALLEEHREIGVGQPQGDAADDVGGLEAIPFAADNAAAGLLAAQRAVWFLLWHCLFL